MERSSRLTLPGLLIIESKAVLLFTACLNRPWCCWKALILPLLNTVSVEGKIVKISLKMTHIFVEQFFCQKNSFSIQNFFIVPKKVFFNSMFFVPNFRFKIFFSSKKHFWGFSKKWKFQPLTSLKNGHLSEEILTQNFIDWLSKS